MNRHETNLPKTFLLLFFGVLLSRIPFIWFGYGLDPDAWRVVDASQILAETGIYQASRLPGYPVYEYFMAFSQSYKSPVISNLITSIFSALSICFFSLILHKIGIKRFILPSLALAFVPVIYVNSVNTMDYMLAFSLVLAAFYGVLKGNYLTAGILLGVAIGCRITSGAMLLPFSLLIFLDEKSHKATRLTKLSTSALVVTLLMYLPVFNAYGFGFFDFYDHRSYNIIDAIVKFSIKTWGILGFISVFITLLVTSCYIFRYKLLTSLQKRVLIASLLINILYLIAFIRLPHEPAYLIPVVAFTIVIITLLLPSVLVTLFSLSLILSPFALTLQKDSINASGPIIQDTLKKQKSLLENQKIIDEIRNLTRKHVIIAGPRMPSLKHSFTGLNSQHILIYKLTDKEREAYIHKGYTIIDINDLKNKTL